MFDSTCSVLTTLRINNLEPGGSGFLLRKVSLRIKTVIIVAFSLPWVQESGQRLEAVRRTATYRVLSTDPLSVGLSVKPVNGTSNTAVMTVSRLVSTGHAGQGTPTQVYWAGYHHLGTTTRYPTLGQKEAESVKSDRKCRSSGSQQGFWRTFD